MKVNHTGSSSQNVSKHVAYSSILGAYVTVVGTILGIVFTWSQLRIAHSEEDRAQRAEPLAYTLEAVNTHYQYDIQLDDIAASLPAPSFRLQVTHGSLHSVTAISFDGSVFHELSSLAIQDRWHSCTVDITMPAKSIIVDGETIYDYFFLFLEPTEGQPRLDMVYNVIDLDTQQIRSNILHPVSLVQLDFLHEGPHREILSVYNTLQKNLEKIVLPLQKAGNPAL